MIPSITATVAAFAPEIKDSPFARFSKKEALPKDILLAVSRNEMSSIFLTFLRLVKKLIIISDILGAIENAFSEKDSPLAKFSRKDALPIAILSTVFRKVVSSKSLTFFRSLSINLIVSITLDTTFLAGTENFSALLKFSKKMPAPVAKVSAVFRTLKSSMFAIPFRSSTIDLMTAVTLMPASGSSSFIFFNSTISGAIAEANDPSASSSFIERPCLSSRSFSLSTACFLIISSIDNKTLLLSTHIARSTFATISVLSVAF